MNSWTKHSNIVNEKDLIYSLNSILYADKKKPPAFLNTSQKKFSFLLRFISSLSLEKFLEGISQLKMAEEKKNPEIWKAVPMADHNEKIQKLPEKLDGVPNFRRVPGYKVYCCGQPTKEGFSKVIDKVCGDKYPKDNAEKPIIWVNMRQEPILYINGNPICARPPNKIGEYAELGNVTSKPILF